MGPRINRRTVENVKKAGVETLQIAGAETGDLALLVHRMDIRPSYES
ncbi:MAG: hypothetical protein GTN71_07500 [Anaerolineae bacterium]|nr:hypothetical protein [Anaerolineae bacterium]